MKSELTRVFFFFNNKLTISFLLLQLEMSKIDYRIKLYLLEIILHLFKIYYSRTSLVRTSGDSQNPFALSGIRINQCHLH